MDQDKIRKLLLFYCALVFAAAAAIIVVVYVVISWASDHITEEIPLREPEKIGQVRITPNAGGSAPTLIPSATPEPLEGMSSPMFCKMHLAGLSAKAKEQGAAGILTLNKYEFGKNACIYEVKNAVSIGNSAELEISQNTDTGEYKITIRATKGKEEPLQKWGESALIYFDSDISAGSAESAIREALQGSEADIEHFSVSTRNDVIIKGDSVDSVRVLEIRSNTAPEGN